jgi:Tol biopolymer transport system component
LAHAGQSTELVSVATGGAQGNSHSFTPSISADGRFVAFVSIAGNLVPGDSDYPSGTYDAFVRDRQTGITERVSVAPDGAGGNDITGNPLSISADGRFVAFNSSASNLVAGDTNNTGDIFVRDRQTSVTEQVSVATDGAEANSNSVRPSVSADGRFVAFYSNATNLVAGDTNNREDVFIHDRQTGVTERVSIATGGAQANGDSEVPGLTSGPSLSADGRFVVFYSNATNLVTGDNNGQYDGFIRDRQMNVTQRVSVATDGGDPNGDSFAPSISADGRFVAFESNASNLVAGDTNNNRDVFVLDRQTGVTERVSVATGGTQADNYILDQDRIPDCCPSLRADFSPSISADGRFVLFNSDASNLVPGDTNNTRDTFVRDRRKGVTERVNVATDGTQANNFSLTPSSISADGRFAAFWTPASNLVSGDNNDRYDVFVRDRGKQNLLVFSGFDSPLVNEITNTTKAGSAIPIKWQVTDEDGKFVSDLAIVSSLQFAPVACDNQDLYLNSPIDALAPGGSDLHYDTVNNEFIFGWKTQKSQAKSCDVFILTLNDGQQEFARFLLK